MTTPLRVAIAGAGNIAWAHLIAWRHDPAVEISAIVDPDVARASALRDRVGLPASTVIGANVDEALVTDPHCLDICAPPFLHGSYARAALDHSAHAVVEKPPAGSLAEFDALIAHSARTGKRLLPVLQNRLGTGPRQVYALREAGLLGRFLHGSVETHWRRGADYYAAPWRGKHATEIGGPWAGLAIHTLDLCLPLLPAVVSVQAHVDTLIHRIDVEDCGVAMLRLAGGSWFVHTVTTHAQREHTRGLLVFEHAQVEFGPDTYHYAATPWKIVSADAKRQQQIDEAIKRVEDPVTPAGQDQLWYRQARQWCELLRNGDPAGRDLASSRPAFETLTAIYAAARSNATVQLPITAAHPQYHRLAP